MGFLRRFYPFNAEQTVNILSEFGPLVAMFIVNAAAGINAGTWALLISTVIAIVVMRHVLGRFPLFPIIASSVTITFGTLTLATGDPMWVQIKVSIFNALFAGFLFGGLWWRSTFMGTRSIVAVGALTTIALLAQYPYVDIHAQLPPLGDDSNPLTTNLLCVGALVVGFMLGASVFRRNFFGYVFEKTFHFTDEGWDRFTFSFAWFFVFTAVLNEVIRQVFDSDTYYDLPLLGSMTGISIWILFKVAFIMPLSAIYAWYLTRLMQRFRIDGPDHVSQVAPAVDAVGQGYMAHARSNTAPSK